MGRSTIHISVPDAVRSYVEARVSASGYSTVSEYFRVLIRNDRREQMRIAALAKRFGTQPIDPFADFEPPPGGLE